MHKQRIGRSAKFLGVMEQKMLQNIVSINSVIEIRICVP